MTAFEAMGMSDADSARFFSCLLDNMPCGAALHKLIVDERGKPVDYETVEVNERFCEILGVDASEVLNIPAGKHLAAHELKHWLDIFAPVALGSRCRKYTMYSSARNQRFSGSVISPAKGYFFVVFMPD